MVSYTPRLVWYCRWNRQFDLWNLNADTEEPFVSTQIGSGKALNKLAWDKEGKKAAIGSSDGHVYVYDIGEVRVKKNLM